MQMKSGVLSVALLVSVAGACNLCVEVFAAAPRDYRFRVGSGGGSMVSAATEDDLYYGGFDGNWEGELYPIEAPSNPFAGKISAFPAKKTEVRISIEKGKVQVFLKRDRGWQEVKPGNFAIIAHKTNAIIYASDSSTDVHDRTGSGGWVETWNYTVTHKDKNTLYVYFVTVVNNYLRAYDEKPDARFYRSSFGEFRRIN